MLQDSQQQLPMSSSDVAQGQVRDVSASTRRSKSVLHTVARVLLPVTGGATIFLAGVALGPTLNPADTGGSPADVPCDSIPYWLTNATVPEGIPESFDTRNEWIGCGQFVVNQGQCGDCWAASGANTLGDRACVHLKADGTAIGLPRGGAGGIGATERLFQISGKCVGKGDDALAHQHGCKRAVEFASPQKLVSCANDNVTTAPTFHADQADYTVGKTLYPDSSGCNGGEARDAWRFFFHEGLTSFDATQKAGCTPYTSDSCSGKDPNNNGCHSCAGFDQCSDTGEKPKVVTVDSWGWIMEEDLPARTENGSTGIPRPVSQMDAMARQVQKMQIEMMTNGPLHVCIDDFSNFGDFFNNHGAGIYNSTEGTPMTGGHCIELVGWGVDRESRMPYWTFKNSWNKDWVNSGFARWIRGVDLCGIESDVWAGCPSGSACKLTEGVVHWENEDPTRNTRPLAPAPHPTSASRPSRNWPGGKEMELSREAASHSSVAPLVVAAVRKATRDLSLPSDKALAAAKRVWSRSRHGLRVRVEVDGLGDQWFAHKHPTGEIKDE